MHRIVERIVPLVLCGGLSFGLMTVCAAAQSAEPTKVKVSPEEIDLGELPTFESKGAVLTITNTDSKPRTVKTIRQSCGCTNLKFTPDTVIAPHQSIEVEIKMSAGPSPGRQLNKRIYVTVEGQDDVIVPIKATAVSFVIIEPAMLDPEVNSDGRFTLKSKDGQPFRITSMIPAYIEDLPIEARSEHVLNLDWRKFREIGPQAAFGLYFDHPQCKQAWAKVKCETSLAGSKPRGGNDVDAPEPDFDKAIREGRNIEVFQRIDEIDDVNKGEKPGPSLLCKAARAGNVELVTYLLARGANREGADAMGRTPLMHAAQSKNSLAVLVLLAAGCKVSPIDSLGGNALAWAAGMGDADSVRVLINAKSDVNNVGSTTGWTPLIWAAGFGDPASIPLLVKAGANIEAADHLQGATALIQAARTGKTEAVNQLILSGAKIDAVDRHGKTALLAASETSGGTTEKIQSLLGAGADPGAVDHRGLNALQLARKRTDMRSPDVVVLLESLIENVTPVDHPARTDAK